jgi:hypothetical protein
MFPNALLNRYSKNLRACAISLVCFTVLSGENVQINEQGLFLTLFAEDPDVVTPVGLAVGAKDEVYVIESHTHSRPSNYTGPVTDRIKVFTDNDSDGVADSHFVFAEGFNAGMNLAFSKVGVLYVLCAWSLYALPDRDGDGVCDEPELVLTLDTKAGNPHGCWLGITFDEENYMYLSRGNVGGDYYRIEGKDGSLVEGYGDGGNVVRARADGTEVEEWATGFWNSMDLKFDHRGDLLLLDNDPDARGPNRLLRVVEGGDYGHIHMFGGAGRHPFQGWDGSFPGHLPFISGTGEAPSGLIDVSAKGEHSLLISIWNENNIERHNLLSTGEVEKSLFMSGGKDFRPVALDQDSEGNLFISDWMLVDYPNHGRGRIWRVSKLPIAHAVSKEPEPVPNQRSIASLLKDNDAFTRHRGEMWLSKAENSSIAEALSKSTDPQVRLGAYLALRRSNHSDSRTFIQKALADPDGEVRRLALLWAAQSLDLSLRSSLDDVLKAGEVTPMLFNTYLAALEMVNEDFIKSYRARATSSKKLKRELKPDLLIKLARDDSLTASVRAEAVRRLEAEDALEFLKSREEVILFAAINTLAGLNQPEVRARFLELALDAKQATSIRAEALLALSKQSLEDPSALIPLLRDKEKEVAYEATRTLRFHMGNSELKKTFLQLSNEPLNNDRQDELVEAALYGFAPGNRYADLRPKTLEAWKETALEGGDPIRGSRVFRSVQTMCTQCHAVDGGGTKLGPDLGGIAQSVSRAQIAHSVLRPSDSFPPQYQAWNIYTTDGQVHSGIQIDHQSRGAMLLYTTENINRRFEAEEVKNYEASAYSLMPHGLENTMTVAEFRDLVAYLASLN